MNINPNTRRAIDYFLLSLFMALLPTLAHAEDEITNSWRYSVTMADKNHIDITLPVCSYSGRDAWHRGSYVYYREVGTSDWRTLFKVWSWSQKDSKTSADIKLEAWPNTLYLQNPSSGSPQGITTSSGGAGYSVKKSSNDDNPVAKVRWEVANELRGKTLEFYVKLVWDHTAQLTPGNKEIFIDGQISLPETQEVYSPEVMEPILSYDAAKAGYIMLPWMIMANNVTKVRLSYLNEKNNRVYVNETSTQQSSGFFYVDAFVPHHQARTEVIYNHADYGTSLGYLKSNAVNIKMLHVAKNFSATEDFDGNVTLKWEINNIDEEDISDGDTWEIQRNSSGSLDMSDSGWKTIANVAYSDWSSTEGNSAYFEYVDETMLKNYDGAPSYRIRRASTSVWGWRDGAGAATAKVNNPSYLSGITMFTAGKGTQWESGVHEVNLSWSQQDELITNYDTYLILCTNGRIFGNYNEAIAKGCEPLMLLFKDGNKWKAISINEIAYNPKTSEENVDCVTNFRVTYAQVFDNNYFDKSESYSEWDVIANNGKLEQALTYIQSILGANVRLKNVNGIEKRARFCNGSSYYYTPNGNQLEFSSSYYDHVSRLDTVNYYFSLRGLWVANDAKNAELNELTNQADGSKYIFDPQAQMILETFAVNQTTRDTVDVVREVLTEEEIVDRKVTRTLSRPCVDYVFRLTINRGKSKLPMSTNGKLSAFATKEESGAAANYAFDNTGTIPTLTTTTMQDRVVLEWETDGDIANYYQVYRDGDVIADKLVERSYVDVTAYPKQTYTYQIKGITFCEGQTYEMKSPATIGNIEPTGCVSGHVRMSDGTSMGGKTVVLNKGSQQIMSCITDEDGAYEMKGIEYENGEAFELSVPTTGEEGVFRARSISFDGYTNTRRNVDFELAEYYNYSGYVLYAGSSIPVSGVSFLCDGILVTNASGNAIQTDNWGAFSISVPRGTHKICAVKDGHVMTNDGYILDLDKQGDEQREYYWSKDVSGIYLWDETKVSLQGRVVGGNEQGLLPLGKSLSKNNLGDDLKIVLQLEGDNTSWIVRDQMDNTVKTRQETFAHGVEDTTQVLSERHRIIISPDNSTGEYLAKLPPVKYKVVEISAAGYATLFQAGKVGETLDLTDYKSGDTAVYNRIYHSPAILNYQQVTNGKDLYFGNRTYTATDITGAKQTVTLWTAENGYALGKPVFSAGVPYVFTLQAQEEYYYNNSTRNLPDIVKLSGGKVTIHNSTINTNSSETIGLDAEGRATYTFAPTNVARDLSEGDAVRSISLTMFMDNTYYDAMPLECYVMQSTPKPNGKRVVSAGPIHLIDILRDPPGTNSYSWIESGSSWTYGYNEKFNFSTGTSLSFGFGSGGSGYMGTIVGQTAESGKVFSSKSSNYLELDLVMEIEGNTTYNYTFKTNERLQTSSEKKMVGAKADLFIGMQQNLIIQEALAIRAVPRTMYIQLLPSIKANKAKLIAKGYDAALKDSVYLVYDNVISAGTKVASTFAHTQSYIEKDLLPELLGIRNSLILPKGTSKETALAVSQREKRAAYVSKVDLDDDDFGYEYNIYSVDNSYPDSISSLNQTMETWFAFLRHNEQEKITANDLVANYDIDGTSVSYSDEYNVSSSYSKYVRYPGGGGESIASDAIDSFVKLLGKGLTKVLEKVIKGSFADETAGGASETPDKKSFKFETPTGSVLEIVIEPEFEMYTKGYENASESHTKKTGFVISPDKYSNLSVDVLRCKTTAEDLNPEILERYAKDAYDANVDEIVEEIQDANTTYMKYSDYVEYSNFVFRTRGGATRAPYEGQVVTKYFMPGTEICAATIPVDNLKIWTDKAEISNVPYGEAAHFTIYLANETQYPGRCETIFNLSQTDAKNAHGAKIYIDGAPIDGSGRNVFITAGTIVQKVVDVYAGTDYDYDNLTLTFMDLNDAYRLSQLSLSAHFVPSAGKINISSPGDKWVVNTESPYDSTKLGYYMPVRIDGFNVNHRGFDHIELQYKLATQGEKDWVNVCSYYKSDSLMALASGERKLIRNDGYIDERFFAEKDPIEQDYDLRAVVYCRNGSGFVTSSSAILPGVKDTRRPQLFGSPQPINGILGIGEDIKMVFSEPIAGNYLSNVNNFEVFGITNSTDISDGTSLRFDGKNSYAYTGSHNLASKNFTIDFMVKPDVFDTRQLLLQHGTLDSDGPHGFRLIIEKDRSITFDMGGFIDDDEEVTMTTDPIKFNSLSQIVLTYDNETRTFSIYDGNKLIGQKRLITKDYNGSGPIFLGGDPSGAWKDGLNGRMLEYRLWTRCQTPGEIASYSRKSLTGYELGLVDCCHLNEGRGVYSYNSGVGGIDMKLEGTSWSVPDGISLHFAEDGKGVKLNPDVFERMDYEDYSLSFWLKTTDKNGTIVSNGLATNEPGAYNHVNLSIENGNLVFRASGKECSVGSAIDVCDGQWHHIAVSVFRAMNVGNIYVDGLHTNSFPVDKVGGVSGGTLALGATYINPQSPINILEGNIDEFAFYSMAVPANLMKEYGNIIPTGTEIGLLAYLSFDEDQVQMDGSHRLMPVGTSLKKYKDNNGNLITNKVDSVIEQSEIELLADRIVYAPMKAMPEMENIRYSYVTVDNELIINIDVPDVRVEKSTVMITVKDVADLNGNLMASPVTMNLYVYRNPLRWNQRSVNIETDYAEQVTAEFSFQNLSGNSLTYRLEGLPNWLTLSETTSKIGPLSEKTIRMTVSEFTNIGDFDEVLYLISEDGMVEPLPITIKVRGERPDWSVANNLKKQSMHVVARVVMDGIIADRETDMLGAFGPGNVCLGVANITVNKTDGSDKPVVYMTIYTDKALNSPLTFQFFDSSTGKISIVEPQDAAVAKFVDGAVVGSTNNPAVFCSSDKVVQTIALHEGWNWISFFVKQQTTTTDTATGEIVTSPYIRLGDLLDHAAVWQYNDAFEFVSDTLATVLLYNNKARIDENGKNYLSCEWDEQDRYVYVDPTQMYRIYSGNNKNSYISGLYADPTVVVHKGWNRLSYISDINLPIATALGDYTDKASEGDLIKSEEQFAILSVDDGNNKRWEGSLTFLKSGKGYMLLRSADDAVSFAYPKYSSANRYTGSLKAASIAADEFNSGSATTMSIVAEVCGIDLEDGDMLVAKRGDVVVGKANAASGGLFFLSVGDGEFAGAMRGAPITFSIERDAKLQATSSVTIRYSANAIVGGLKTPYTIDFSTTTEAETADTGWFTLSGVRLQGKPQMPGLYIHNNKRELVK